MKSSRKRLLFSIYVVWFYHDDFFVTLGIERYKFFIIMHCPFCDTPDSKVIDSRLAAQGAQIRRRRECTKCGERFTTFESYEVVMPRVIKSNGKNEPFDEQKLRRSLMHALQKRPVTQEQIEETVSNIHQHIRRLGERDVRSLTIGEIVMQALYSLDHVAYVRFASVYHDFQNVDAFREQIEKMQLREQSVFVEDKKYE